MGPQVHRCEKPFGPCETTVRNKEGVTPKVGKTWVRDDPDREGPEHEQQRDVGRIRSESRRFEELVEMRAEELDTTGGGRVCV